jgi:hypothetical protein
LLFTAGSFFFIGTSDVLCFCAIVYLYPSAP